MSKPRKAENRGLPARWQFRHGAWYYRVPPGREDLWDGKTQFLLGRTLPEAYRAYAERLGSANTVRTIGELLDRYLLEVVPVKAPSTQETNRLAIRCLRGVFGERPLSPFPPVLVYQYVDKRSKKHRDAETGKVTGGRVAAHREIEVLSHAYTKAVQWGYIDRHPFKGEVRLEGERARNRYVEDWEIVECLSLPSKRKKGSVRAIQAYLRLKLLTGMARGDLLRLRPAEFTDDGIPVQRHKTAGTSGKRTVYAWTAELRAAVSMALEARPVHISPWLFCTRRGECYIKGPKETANGFDSMWGRFVERVLKETKVKERFHEHDMRAKVASDAKSLEHARALLAHSDSRMTERAYRRKPERVLPLR